MALQYRSIGLSRTRLQYGKVEILLILVAKESGVFLGSLYIVSFSCMSNADRHHRLCILELVEKLPNIREIALDPFLIPISTPSL